MALSAIAARISEFGFTPNRVAAAWRESHSARQPGVDGVALCALRASPGSFAALERWQIAYLPVYAVWAALVVYVPAAVRLPLSDS